MTTPFERIAFVVYPVWTYYRLKLCEQVPEKSLLDRIPAEKAQRMLDALPHLGRAEATFLALMADIIAGEEPLGDMQTFGNADAPPPS